MELLSVLPFVGQVITDTQLLDMLTNDYWNIITHGNGAFTVMTDFDGIFNMQYIDGNYTVTSVLPTEDFDI